MVTSYDTGSSFGIRELTGQGRNVVLTGRGLPYRPIELHTKQRVDTKWYPGYPEATATILGSQEEPTTINGMWKDRFIATTGASGAPVQGQSDVFPITVNDTPVPDVGAAVALLDDITRKGQAVEVTWINITRVGHITDFVTRWQNSHDVEWEITFEWTSRGEPTAPAVVFMGNGLGDVAGQFSVQNAQIQEAAAFLFPVEPDFQQELIAALADVNDAVNAAVSTASQLAVSSITPFDATRRAISTCNGVVLTAQGIVDVMSSRVPYARNVSRPIATLTFGQRLAAVDYANTLISLSRGLQRTALTRQSVLSQGILDQLAGIYTAKSGDDLRAVSRRYYATPFEWRRIASFNNLDVIDLEANQVVLVPLIQTGDTRM